MYTLNETKGRAEYGRKFHSIAYFVEKHLVGSAAIECDHWHDGAGVVPHHVAMTLEMEQAMQSVDPATSLGYWDVTLDSARQDATGRPWSTSEIFSDDWFGPASPDNADHVLATGRWAYTAAARVDTSTNPPVASETGVGGGAAAVGGGARGAGPTSVPHNAWGLLRSPWNTNPTPFVTRYEYQDGATAWGSLPTCNDFLTCYKAANFSDMNNCLNGATHGPVHILIGGIWHKQLHPLIDERFGYFLLLMSKNLWRQVIHVLN